MYLIAELSGPTTLTSFYPIPNYLVKDHVTLLATFVPEGVFFVTLSCLLCQALRFAYFRAFFLTRPVFRFRSHAGRSYFPEPSVPVVLVAHMIAVPIFFSSALST